MYNTRYMVAKNVSAGEDQSLEPDLIRVPSGCKALVKSLLL